MRAPELAKKEEAQLVMLSVGPEHYMRRAYVTQGSCNAGGRASG